MAKSSEQKKHYNYLETQMRIMMWLGLIRPRDTHPIINALFIFRTIFFLGTYAVLIIGCIAHMKFVNDFDLLASSINVLQVIVYLMAIVHLGYYQFENEAVHDLVERIRENFRFASNTGHFTMDKPARADKLRSLGWIGLCIIAVISWFALETAKGDDTIPVWAPVNLQESPYYEIDTFLQFTGQFIMGSNGGCFGAFFMSVLTIFRYQLDVLSSSLEHMAPLAVLKTWKRIGNGNEKLSHEIASKDCASNPGGVDIEISHQCECCTEEFKWIFATFERRRFNNALTPIEERIYQEELYDTLKDCIIHHQNIVELRDVIQDFFAPVMLIRFVLITMMLCFTIYSSNKIMTREDFSPSDVTFISLAEYYAMAIGELFIFCTIADNLLRMSITIPNVVYERLPWHGGSVTKKFISTWKIFHLNAMRPTSLRTAFYVVSLEIFRSILGTSFSFYTVLRRLQNDPGNEKQ